MRSLIATLLIAATPGLSLAQTVVGAPATQPPALLVDQLLHVDAQPAAGGATQIMPLWSTPDGRILAIVAMAGNGVPSMPLSPQIGSATDWQWVDVTNFVSTGALLRATPNLGVHASFDRAVSYTPVYALPTLFCAPTANASPQQSCAFNAPAANYSAFRLGTDWTVNDALDVDFSYGLSWLRRDNSTPLATDLRPGWDLLAAGNSGVVPSLIIPGGELANIQNSGVSALSHWRLSDTETLNIGASLGHLQFSGMGNLPLANFNQATLGVGLSHGSFSGMVVGRVLGPADPINGSQRWSGLDLGISWRTPWQGELRFGAQNVWSSGSLPTLSEPATTREIDANQARVPYVQYHQDL
ncbi:MAG TPA: hypothetical protein VF132_12020 [Rudaea sp.]